jgi:hypothetical protein
VQIQSLDKSDGEVASIFNAINSHHNNIFLPYRDATNRPVTRRTSRSS